jgi:tight adherence protein C
MELVTIGILVLIAAALLGYSLMPKRGEEREAVKRRLSGRQGVDETAGIREKARATATENMVRRAGPMLSRLIMPTSDQEQNNLRAKLASAGYRHAQAQTFFLASKTVIGVVGLCAAAFFAFTRGNELVTGAGLAAFGGGMGFMLPNLWLALAVKARKEKVRHALPDTLDLLVVSVESGLALDAAFKRVGEEMALVHPELSEELRISTMEAQMGIPRAEALDNMARRTAVDEMRSLVSVIMQAEKFGTSVARALRNQAESLRTKRHQAAEERAQKTAVKLMLPLVLFIFPAMGVVLAGPAALKMIEALKANPTLN